MNKIFFHLGSLVMKGKTISSFHSLKAFNINITFASSIYKGWGLIKTGFWSWLLGLTYCTLDLHDEWILEKWKVDMELLVPSSVYSWHLDIDVTIEDCNHRSLTNCSIQTLATGLKNMPTLWFTYWLTVLLAMR